MTDWIAPPRYKNGLAGAWGRGTLEGVTTDETTD